MKKTLNLTNYERTSLKELKADLMVRKLLTAHLAGLDRKADVIVALQHDGEKIVNASAGASSTAGHAVKKEEKK